MINHPSTCTQTDYIRTSISAVTAVLNIGIGAGVMAAVIIISAYNFLLSAQKLKEIFGSGIYDALKLIRTSFLVTLLRNQTKSLSPSSTSNI
jgi:hypothetical protein